METGERIVARNVVQQQQSHVNGGVILERITGNGVND
jgi:hypothetical protein